MNRIKVVIFEPGKPGRVDCIPDKLQNMQRVVGGERSERCRWQGKRGERVAAVEKSEPDPAKDFSGTATGKVTDQLKQNGHCLQKVKLKRVHLSRELVCGYNEEGRLLGLPENRFGICGTFFVARDDGGEALVSLTREQVAFLTGKFMACTAENNTNREDKT